MFALGKTGCCGLMFLLSSLAAATAQSPLKYIDAQPLQGASLAVIVDDVPLVHTVQLLPVGQDGQLQHPGNIAAQTLATLEQLDRVLKDAGSSLSLLVRLHVCVKEQADVAAIQTELARIFIGPSRPALTVVVSDLPLDGALIAIDAVAAAPAVQSRAVTIHPAAAILPAGPRVFISGQAEAGDLATATRGTLESLDRTLDYLKLNKSHIVQLKAFVTPVAGHKIVMAEVARFFGNRPAPPVVLVEWKSNLPIEIELVASDPQARSDTSRPAVEYLAPPHLKPSPIFSRLTRVHAPRTIYTSGLTGAAGESGEAQVRQIFATLQKLTQQSDSDLMHLAKATYYVSNDDASQKLNLIRPQFYNPQRPPAASKAMVRGVGADGLGIAVDMIAAPVAK